jgi:hypothetical protein
MEVWQSPFMQNGAHTSDTLVGADDGTIVGDSVVGANVGLVGAIEGCEVGLFFERKCSTLQAKLRMRSGRASENDDSHRALI